MSVTFTFKSLDGVIGHVSKMFGEDIPVSDISGILVPDAITYHHQRTLMPQCKWLSGRCDWETHLTYPEKTILVLEWSETPTARDRNIRAAAYLAHEGASENLIPFAGIHYFTGGKKVRLARGNHETVHPGPLLYLYADTKPLLPYILFATFADSIKGKFSGEWASAWEKGALSKQPFLPMITPAQKLITFIVYVAKELEKGVEIWDVSPHDKLYDIVCDRLMERQKPSQWSPRQEIIINYQPRIKWNCSMVE
jgi:hypothetical protein